MDGMESLLQVALSARKRAYAPYSHFKVGAALLCSDGKVHTGCNIENAAYSPSMCAERVAFAKAVSEGLPDSELGGEQTKATHKDWCGYFKAIAIVGGVADRRDTDYCTPCGVCRQVMSEFCAPDFIITCARTDESGNISEMKQWTLKELLPEGFGSPTLTIP